MFSILSDLILPICCKFNNFAPLAFMLAFFLALSVGQVRSCGEERFRIILLIQSLVPLLSLINAAMADQSLVSKAYIIFFIISQAPSAYKNWAFANRFLFHFVHLSCFFLLQDHLVDSKWFSDQDSLMIKSVFNRTLSS
nr:uncharacterized protein LOC107438495 [Parasteatoda tepidariorum]